MEAASASHLYGESALHPLTHHRLTPAMMTSEQTDIDLFLPAELDSLPDEAHVRPSDRSSCPSIRDHTVQ